MANNIILDVDVAVDFLAGHPPHDRPAAEAFDKAVQMDCRIWLVAASLPTLRERLEEAFRTAAEGKGKPPDRAAASSRARETLQGFLGKVHVLSSYGFDGEAVFARETPTGGMILCAADALKEDVFILSRDPALLGTDRRVLDPRSFADRDEPGDGPSQGIPFVDLARQQQRILTQVEEGFSNVLRHGQYIMGPEIRALEEKLAAYAGVDHAICCASGTDALLLALMAYGVGPGDAIFTSPFTFISTAEVISLLGATPVFVDIDPRTFNMDPTCLEKAIAACKENRPETYPLPASPVTPQTDLEPRGIIAVDLFGLPVDYDRVNEIACRHDLFVIEDAAQSFGAEVQGKKAGSLGDIGCTSFFPAKPLGCYGDGGAVFTNDPELTDRMVSIRIHGKGKDKYDNERIGLNARMDTLQAALLLPKLAIFPEELVARNRVASRYTECLSPLPSITTPHVPEGYRSAWAQYSILTDSRDQIQAHMKAKGIPTAVYYPKPLHLQTAFAGLGYKEGDFPASESAARRIVSLPMHPYLTDRQLARIAEALNRAIDSGIKKKPTE
jgi:UDP-2-acetamido-2-deoxy-ribo-hexuluronate aminotransferase